MPIYSFIRTYAYLQYLFTPILFHPLLTSCFQFKSCLIFIFMYLNIHFFILHLFFHFSLFHFHFFIAIFIFLKPITIMLFLCMNVHCMPLYVCMYLPLTAAVSGP